MGASCTLGDGSVSWAMWPGEAAAPARPNPQPWDLSLADGSITLLNCCYTRGPFFSDIAESVSVDGAPAGGEFWIGAKIDTLTGSVSSVCGDLTDCSVPLSEAGTYSQDYVIVPLYKMNAMKKDGKTSYAVLLDLRGMTNPVVYV